MDTTARPRLLLIDGHSMAYRAFFALPVENFATTTGEPTNAVYGFTSMLVNLLRDEAPTHAAVAFDTSRVTFRTALYPEYKGTRAETPAEFRGQVPLIKEVLDALGIVWLEKDEYEADDILATLSTNGRLAGMEVLISSGDRDTLQLVGPDVTVLYPRRGVSDLARMTPAAVQEKYGVDPEHYPDLAALVGETSDNLPGVPKVGPRTAAKWIGAYGSLEGLVAHVDEVGGKLGENLRAHLDQVLLNRRLGALVRDLDLPRTPKELALGRWRREDVHRVFDALQFNTLRERLFAVLAEEEDTERDALDVHVAHLEPGALEAWLEVRRRAPIGLEVTGSVARGTGDAWRAALADDQGRTVLLDLTDLPPADESALAGWLADASAPKVCHDAKFAWHALDGRGLTLTGVDFDTQLAAYLCFPDQRGYDLGDLCMRVLGRDLAGAEEAGQGTLDLADDDPAAARAAAVVALREPLARALADRGAADLLTDLELPLVEVLARMERTGIAVDEAHLAELDHDFAETAARAQAEAWDAIGGRQVNLGSPKQLQEVLFDQLDMPRTKRTKTGWTTDAEALAELYARTSHPFLEHLLAHRDVTKLRQTVEGLRKAVAEDGRIHTTFAQTVAATGRLSSADPNLQNIPVRTEAGRLIRRAFVVGRDYVTLMTVDYSQIEMRIMAHLSGDPGLVEAFRSGEDLHSFVASKVFGVPSADVTPAQRSRIKAMSYGLAYGLSAYGLSRQLGITPGEATALMEEYFARFGAIRDYLGGVVAEARRLGYTQTILGRRRYLPDLTSDNRQRREMAERMALNAPIQGSAADIVKVAMLAVQRELDAAGLASRMLLQVHDELVLEIAEGETERVEQIVRAAMGSAAQLSVPLDVSVGVGRTWQDAAH